MLHNVVWVLQIHKQHDYHKLSLRCYNMLHDFLIHYLLVMCIQTPCTHQEILGSLVNGIQTLLDGAILILWKLVLMGQQKKIQILQFVSTPSSPQP